MHKHPSVGPDSEDPQARLAVAWTIVIQSLVVVVVVMHYLRVCQVRYAFFLCDAYACSFVRVFVSWMSPADKLLVSILGLPFSVRTSVCCGIFLIFTPDETDGTADPVLSWEWGSTSTHCSWQGSSPL